MKTREETFAHKIRVKETLDHYRQSLASAKKEGQPPHVLSRISHLVQQTKGYWQALKWVLDEYGDEESIEDFVSEIPIDFKDNSC